MLMGEWKPEKEITQGSPKWLLQLVAWPAAQHEPLLEFTKCLLKGAKFCTGK